MKRVGLPERPDPPLPGSRTLAVPEEGTEGRANFSGQEGAKCIRPVQNGPDAGENARKPERQEDHGGELNVELHREESHCDLHAID